MDYGTAGFAPQPSWYAVLTRSRQEKTAATMLDSLGIRRFLPTIMELHQWSDRKKIVDLPLFPGYLFVHVTLSAETTLRVRKVPGIVDLVGNQSGPLSIPDCEIEDIHTVLARGVQCAPHPYLKEGERIRVVRGLLAGIEGRFVRSGSKDQLILSVDMIQRSLALNVSLKDVEPVNIAREGFPELSNSAPAPSSLSA